MPRKRDKSGLAPILPVNVVNRKTGKKNVKVTGRIAAENIFSDVAEQTSKHFIKKGSTRKKEAAIRRRLAKKFGARMDSNEAKRLDIKRKRAK